MYSDIAIIRFHIDCFFPIIIVCDFMFAKVVPDLNIQFDFIPEPTYIF